MEKQEQALEKYTVVQPGRHGEVGQVLNMHPRKATFLLTQQLVLKGELKGKNLSDKLKELEKAKPVISEEETQTEEKAQ